MAIIFIKPKVNLMLKPKICHYYGLKIYSQKFIKYTYSLHIFFFVALRPNTGHGLLILEVF